MSGPGLAVPALPEIDDDLIPGLAAGLERVEALLGRRVAHEDPFIAEASGHLLQAGGKRFRPMLAVLVSYLGQGPTDEVVVAATGVELTHLASLYHDDVMDEADLRRAVPSANARFGNTTAILVGDLLFGTASSLIADLGPQAVKIQAETFVRLCTGQIRDGRPAPPGTDPIDYYLSVLADKTGSLVATAARYGAMFSRCPPEHVEIARQYGEKLGVAFQLADDLLDITATSGQSGKEPGTDLRAGVRTLPILYVRAAAGPDDARLIALLDADLSADDDAHAEALTLLRHHPALRRAEAMTRQVSESAQHLLDPLGEGPVVRALRALAASVADRAG